MMKLSLVIPVYKKTEMFMENFIQNIPLLPKNTEIIIVDDASHENLSGKIAPFKRKAHIIFIQNEKNLGFAAAINKGISAAKGNYILLLGSDIRLMKEFPTSLETEFVNDKNIAAITFAEKDNGGELLGKSTIYFKRGLILHKRAHDTLRGNAAWANGGSCLFRADYLKTLGGFDEMYAPFYWEDIDLSYRAYSRGWKVLFYPKYVVAHARESTISTFFKATHIQHIAYRNQFIFTWSNITDFSMLIKHFLWLPINLFLMSVKGETGFVTGFFSALPYILTILSRRFVKLHKQSVSDADIFALFL